MATVFGVAKEVKEQEGRLSMQPDGVAELGDHGHEGFVQAAAGEGGGFEDQGYVSCGARVVETTDGVFEAADLIVKVKEPVPEEYDRFHEGQELFTYSHLAADKELTEYLMDRKVNSIVYETVELPEGSLPLLAPMSEVARRMVVQAAAQHLESTQGGTGLLLGGDLVSEPVAEAHGLPHTSQERILGQNRDEPKERKIRDQRNREVARERQQVRLACHERLRPKHLHHDRREG
jgi:alanine dehydrogenase